MAYRLGVDLGTTFTSAVLLREHAAPEVFALGERSAAVPTVLYSARTERSFTAKRRKPAR
jgi:molecular chaperone DnaK (HSP70)